MRTRNKGILFLIILFISVQPSLGNLLLYNANVNYVTAPSYYQGSGCNWIANICLSLVSNSTINGQMIAVDNSWGTIDTVSIPFEKVVANISYPSSTITIRVYKSTTDNPATSSLYLWDTATISPSNTNIANIDFTLDSPIPIYDNMGNKLVNYIFVELQETYPNTFDRNEIAYGFFQSTSTDIYPNGKNYQYNGAWTSLESHLIQPTYNDMAFKVFGTFHTPPTPSPTPTGTGVPISTPIPAPSGGGTPPVPSEGSGMSGDNAGSSSYCPTCQGNESISTNGTGTVPSNTGISQTMIDLGYCNTEEGCSIYDFINFFYDFSVGAFALSLIYIIVKMFPTKKRRLDEYNVEREYRI